MRKARLGLQGIEREAERLRTLLGISPDLISPYLALPMLRGAWVGSVASGGTWHDISGHGNHLSYQGNPQHSYDGLVPYWDLDGTGDYFNITDAASGNDFDVLGTETYVAAAARGLTMGGWAWIDVLGDYERFMAKWGASGQYAYEICQDVVGNARILFVISSNGVVQTQVASSGQSLTTGIWHFIVVRFDPGEELALFLDSTKYTNTTSIPASIFNSSADFTIGAGHGGAYPMDGRASCCFGCAAALSDGQISNVFERTRGAFEV